MSGIVLPMRYNRDTEVSKLIYRLAGLSIFKYLSVTYRDEHLLATRLFVHALLLYSADTTPTPDFPLRLRTRALTTTGSGLYTIRPVQLLAPPSVWSSLYRLEIDLRIRVTSAAEITTVGR